MRIFLDTNVLLDIVEQRAPHASTSESLLDRCDLLNFKISVAAHGLATLYYIVRRRAGHGTALSAIHQILSWAEVAPLGDLEARRALGYGIANYEDALQAAAAESSGADWLVTRDAKGFINCPITVLTPDDFLERFPAT